MDTIQATPQNPLLGRLARLLALGRDSLNPGAGTPAESAMGAFRPGDWLFGAPAKELEELSYGNLPMQVPPLARIPQFKKGRADSALETALMALPGPVGAAKVSLVGSAAARSVPAQYAQRGAVSLGGLPQLVATHASEKLLDPYAVRDMLRRGLHAPSIGLHAGSPNDYKPNAPALVFGTDKLAAMERQFPVSIYNRDAYLWNPSPASSSSIARQYADELEEIAAHRDHTVARMLPQFKHDSRLFQGIASGTTEHIPASQQAAIQASPLWHSVVGWEKHPFGGGALANSKALIDDYDQAFSGFLEKASDQNYGELALSGRPWPGRFQEGWRPDTDVPAIGPGSRLPAGHPIAAPSRMAEMKVYGDVPLDRENGSVGLWVPTDDIFRYSKTRSALEAWQEAGVPIWTPKDVSALNNLHPLNYEAPANFLHTLAPDTGGILSPLPEEAYSHGAGWLRDTDASSWALGDLYRAEHAKRHGSFWTSQDPRWLTFRPPK
jgi:hypothetical protein